MSGTQAPRLELSLAERRGFLSTRGTSSMVGKCCRLTLPYSYKPTFENSFSFAVSFLKPTKTLCALLNFLFPLPRALEPSIVFDRSLQQVPPLYHSPLSFIQSLGLYRLSSSSSTIHIAWTGNSFVLLFVCWWLHCMSLNCLVWTVFVSVYACVLDILLQWITKVCIVGHPKTSEMKPQIIPTTNLS